MNICITRFNNKTLHECISYNKQINTHNDLLHHQNIFHDWRINKIPHMEKKLKQLRYNYFNSTGVDKKTNRKKLSNVRKDIEIFREYERSYYKEQLDNVTRVIDNKVCNEWVYNVPISLHQSMNKSNIYLIEMNNDTNKICGISKIYNKCYHRRHKIYTDDNYNRYSYIGKRIDIDVLCDIEDFGELYTGLTKILFQGSTHQKRGQGIQKIFKNNLDKINQNGLFIILERLFNENKI